MHARTHIHTHAHIYFPYFDFLYFVTDPHTDIVWTAHQQKLHYTAVCSCYVSVLTTRIQVITPVSEVIYRRIG